MDAITQSGEATQIHDHPIALHNFRHSKAANASSIAQMKIPNQFLSFFIYVCLKIIAVVRMAKRDFPIEIHLL